MAKAPKKKTEPGKPENATSQTAERGKVLMSWEVRPYLLERRKAAILIISTLLFSALVWYAFDLYAGILTVVVSLGSFASFLFPNQYQILEKGLLVKTGINAPVFRKWTAFKDYRFFPDGVHLGYKPRQIRERILKSQFVYFGDADAEAVKEIIAKYMDDVLD